MGQHFPAHALHLSHVELSPRGVYEMRVTITSKPVGAVRGMWLVSLQVGQTYNLKDDVAKALVMNAYAIEERRFGERRRMSRDKAPGRRQMDTHLAKAGHYA